VDLSLEEALMAIMVRGLRKAYGRIDAVRGIDLDVPAGQVFALLGPNGAGKTTTVEILEGYRRRDGGDVQVLGADPAWGGARLRERIGIVLQSGAFDHYLTVTEVLTLWARYYPRRRTVGELLAVAGLEDKARARVRDLSGGQQRRLNLALALAGDPELLFLDEPTTGFDPAARRSAWELIRGLAGRGTTIFLTTHYMEEAQALADQAAVMSEGKIVAMGPPRSLGADHAAVIRFRLPGPPGGSLPPLSGLGPVAGEAGAWELRTSRPTADLHALTGWALEHGVDLASLSVSQPTLEDVYLQLTAPEEAGATSS
jgi:ABC-2 type transport system ATP-binding protein